MKKNSNKLLSHLCYFLGEVKEVLLDTLIFTVLALGIMALTPKRYFDIAVRDVVKESLGANSFLLTFGVSIFLLAICFLFWGPYIQEKKAADFDSLEKLNTRRSDKFIKWNRRSYKYLFFDVNQFNISFGLGSLGVLMAFNIWTLFVEKNFEAAINVSLAWFLLLLLVIAAKQLKHAANLSPVITNLFLDEDKSIDKSHLRYLKGFYFFAGFFMLLLGLATMKNTLQETLEAEHAQSNDACQTLDASRANSQL